MKFRFKLVIELVVLFLIVLFILNKIDISKTLSILKFTNLYWLLFAFIIFLIAKAITSFALKVLFESIKHLNLKEWFKCYFMSFAIELILPGRTGIFSIIYFLKKRGFDIGPSTSLMIIDKIISLIIFGLLSAVGIVVLLKVKELYLSLIVVVLLIFFGLLSFFGFVRKIIKRILGKYSLKFFGFYKTFRNILSNHKKRILINSLLTLFRGIVNGFLLLIILKSLGYAAPLLDIILIGSITFIVSLIPLTPHGVGVRETTGLLLFEKIGIPFEVSLSMYFLLLVINYLTSAFTAIFYLRKEQFYKKVPSQGNLN